MTIHRGHDIANKIEKEIESRLKNTQVLIHMEPKEG